MSAQIPIHTLSNNPNTFYTARKLNPILGGLETEEAHRHTYYEILFFVEGAGTQMIDFETQNLHPGSVHFITPGQVHALNRAKDLKGYVINFTKEFMFLNGGNISVLNDFPSFSKVNAALTNLPAKDFQELLSIVKQMQPERVDSSPLKEALLASYINLILIKSKSLFLSSQAYATRDDPGQKLAERFNALLEENFISAHGVPYYADKLNLSPNHLSAALKKATGKTAGELIQQRLLLESKRLLLHSSSSIKEIAYELSFNDPAYFTRFFKNNTGLSPEIFRRDTRKKYNC